MSKLLLIDGHSMAFRAFYGLPAENFQTSTGQHTNAVYGFVSMLVNLLKEEEPTHLAVAFDISRVSFRTAEYPEYKATRSATPPEFKGQVELIQQVLDAAKIVHLEIENYEADDILATLTTQGAQLGMSVEVCSGDRDLLQLVTDEVTVLYPRRGVTEIDRMTPAAVQAKYGLAPAQYPELAALVGETSDNLPGVPGVGPKTAVKWLKEFGGLDNLISRREQVPGKAGESFREHLDDVKRNRKLNALVTDVPLPVNPDDLERTEIDIAAVNTVFDTLEFRSQLRDRLFGSMVTELPPPVSLEITPVQLGAGKLGGWLAKQQVVGVVPIGTWKAGSGDLQELALSGKSGETISVNLAELNPSDEQALADWLADTRADKVMHAAKGPLEALWARGLDLAGLSCDTELTAYLLHPDQRGYSLSDLLLKYENIDLGLGTAEEEPAQQTLFSMVEEDTTPAKEAFAVLKLSGTLQSKLAAAGQSSLLTEVELPLQRVLAKMEQVGIAADTETMTSIRDSFDDRVLAAEQAAYQVIGHEMNLGSPKQLQTVLFDELGMPKTKKTKSGYTTDASALETLFEKTEHPFLAHLLEHRDAIKLRQIIDGLISSVSDDGRIHTTFQQTVAATGRLSSSEPNLQNIPVRSDEGRRLRECFVQGAGYAGLMSADYSQIEMRVMADASGDQRLIEAFNSGTDFHSITASHVFGVPVDEITPAQRAKVKQMNYGLAYGLSAYGLAAQLRIPQSEAKQLMEDYFATFGAIRDYLRSIVAQARQTGYTETLLGRRRYLPDLNSSNYQRREMAERAALNAPIQGTAADIIKVAMLALDAKLSASSYRSRVLLQVHDELILEIVEGEREEIEALVREVMGNAVQLKVPLDVSVGFGRTWAKAAH